MKKKGILILKLVFFTMFTVYCELWNILDKTVKNLVLLPTSQFITKTLDNTLIFCCCYTQ